MAKGEDADGLPRPMATPYRVSTITAVGSVGVHINLQKFFECVPIEESGEGCKGRACYVYAELAMEWRGTQTTAAKAAATRRLARMAESCHKGGGGRRPRHFDNQVTVVHRTEDGARLNIKVFKNGQVQLTGIKLAKQGDIAVMHLAAMLGDMEQESPGVLQPGGGAPVASGYRVCLINSDFNLGFELMRDRLFHWMRANCDTVCSYEPCIYPGVKINYMWNSEPSTIEHHGVCQCQLPGRLKCGRGAGCGQGQCRKVTIAVFQSGSVIITGAHRLEQLDDAYRFVVDDLAAASYDEILKPDLHLMPFDALSIS